jgi:hypothetical protein
MQYKVPNMHNKAFNNGCKCVEKPWKETLEDYVIQSAKHAQQSIQQCVQVCRETMEGDIGGLCDTKYQTCTTTKDDNNVLN